MLTIFRKVRKSFLNSGQTKRYALYAIGEIALVVIGILIALQINNWNEWRKDRKLEEKILSNLSNNLERNLESISVSIRAHEGRIRSARIILHSIDESLPNHDSLQLHFFFGGLRGTAAETYPARDGYEMFKNEGFDKMTNDSLKNEIVFLFEETYRALTSWGEYSTDSAPHIYDIWYEYFNRTGVRLIPLDYDRILTSTEIRSYYESNIVFSDVYLTRLNSSFRRTERVLQMIKEELTGRNKS